MNLQHSFKKCSTRCHNSTIPRISEAAMMLTSSIKEDYVQNVRAQSDFSFLSPSVESTVWMSFDFVSSVSLRLMADIPAAFIKVISLKRVQWLCPNALHKCLCDFVPLERVQCKFDYDISLKILLSIRVTLFICFTEGSMNQSSATHTNVCCVPWNK